jgi:hypothetical protein
MEEKMLRRKPDHSRFSANEADRERGGGTDGFPLAEDEMSPRDLMTLLTRRVERRIDEAFGKTARTQKEHA